MGGNEYNGNRGRSKKEKEKKKYLFLCMKLEEHELDSKYFSVYLKGIYPFSLRENKDTSGTERPIDP